MKPSGHFVLVTGGASGIGLAIANKFHAAGNQASWLAGTNGPICSLKHRSLMRTLDSVFGIFVTNADFVRHRPSRWLTHQRQSYDRARAQRQEET